MNHKAAREDRLRERVQDLAGELLATGDAMWSHHQRVSLAVFSFMNAQQRRDAEAAPLMKMYDEERVEAMQSANTATARAREIVGVLSLICPDLEGPAAEYVQASIYTGKYENPLPTKEQEELKARARAEFVAKARVTFGSTADCLTAGRVLASPTRVPPDPATPLGRGQHVWPTLEMRAGCAGRVGR